MHGVLTCLPTAATVQDLQRLFYKLLNCGLSHENEPPSIPLFNLVAPHMWIGIWRCTCRGWPFSLASKPIDLGLSFQVHWVNMQLDFSPFVLVGT